MEKQEKISRGVKGMIKLDQINKIKATEIKTMYER